MTHRVRLQQRDDSNTLSRGGREGAASVPTTVHKLSVGSLSSSRRRLSGYVSVSAPLLF
jgi:hypothetical protein